VTENGQTFQTQSSKHSRADSSASLSGQEEESLVQELSMRWNSTLKMIKRVQHNKDPPKATLVQQKHKLTMLTSAEYEVGNTAGAMQVW